VDHLKTCSALLIFTKLHPFYHLNSTQPDHVMWQSPTFKSVQLYGCHMSYIQQLKIKPIKCATSSSSVPPTNQKP